jgi:hypothetical protein
MSDDRYTPEVEWMTEEQAYGHPKPAEPKSWAIVVSREDDPPIAVSSWPEGSEEIARRFAASWNATRGIHIDALEAGHLAALLYAAQLWATGDSLGAQRTREALRALGLEHSAAGRLP